MTSIGVNYYSDYNPKVLLLNDYRHLTNDFHFLNINKYINKYVNNFYMRGGRGEGMGAIMCVIDQRSQVRPYVNVFVCHLVVVVVIKVLNVCAYKRVCHGV